MSRFAAPHIHPRFTPYPIRRKGFTLIEMLVVIVIIMILVTLVVTTIVSALSEMRAAGGAAGVAGFLRDAQVKAVQTGHVMVLRVDRITPADASTPFWQFTAWQFPTDADALIKTQRGTVNANDWPINELPSVTFNLEPTQNLYIVVDGFDNAPDALDLPNLILLPDGTANHDFQIEVFDVTTDPVVSGDTATFVQLQRSTGRVYLLGPRFNNH